MNIKNAEISDTMLGLEGHGIFSFMIYLGFNKHSSQGFGGWVLGPDTDKFIKEVLKVVGVEKWEDLKKVSKALKNRVFTAEHREKISQSLKGRSPKLSTRKKLSEALVGRTLSEEHRKKISKGMLSSGRVYKMGHKLSNKVKEKIKRSMKLLGEKKLLWKQKQS